LAVCSCEYYIDWICIDDREQGLAFSYRLQATRGNNQILGIMDNMKKVNEHLLIQLHSACGLKLAT
jgi:hypothetical protein